MGADAGLHGWVPLLGCPMEPLVFYPPLICSPHLGDVRTPWSGEDAGRWEGMRRLGLPWQPAAGEWRFFLAGAAQGWGVEGLEGRGRGGLRRSRAR